jgi:hypothetical protein
VAIHSNSCDEGGIGKHAAAGERPAIQLTVDSRAGGGGPALVGPSGAGSSSHGAPPLSGVAGRDESGGLEYAPDSKAVMARINRWWKKLDEGYMQPHFGGPSRGSSSTNLQALAPPAAAAAVAAPHTSVHQSARSFTVPPRMVG